MAVLWLIEWYMSHQQSIEDSADPPQINFFTIIIFYCQNSYLYFIACYISGAVYKGVPVFVKSEYTYLFLGLSSSVSSDRSFDKIYSAVQSQFLYVPGSLRRLCFLIYYKLFLFISFCPETSLETLKSSILTCTCSCA